MKKQVISMLAAGMMLSSAMMNVNAKTKTMWVLTQPVNGDNGGPTNQTTFSYNRNGLLKKETTRGKDSSNHMRTTTVQYFYDKNGHITKATNNEFNVKTTVKFVTNKNGMVISDNTSGKNTYTYNKKNLMIKSKSKYDGTTRYKYDKNGRMVSDGKYIYKYDRYGYETAQYWHGKKQWSYKNKYNKEKLLISKTGTADGETFKPDTYKYKKIKVNEKYATEVQRQQDALTYRNNYMLAYFEAFVA